MNAASRALNHTERNDAKDTGRSSPREQHNGPPHSTASSARPSESLKGFFLLRLTAGAILQLCSDILILPRMREPLLPKQGFFREEQRIQHRGRVLSAVMSPPSEEEYSHISFISTHSSPLNSQTLTTDYYHTLIPNDNQRLVTALFKSQSHRQF